MGSASRYGQFATVLLLAAAVAEACEIHPIDLLSDPEAPIPVFIPSGAAGPTAPQGGARSDIDIPDPLGGAAGSGATGPGMVTIIDALPKDFTQAEPFGGWHVLDTAVDEEALLSGECANILRVIARDFPESHPDFEVERSNLYLGMVHDQLGDNQKPVLVNPDDPNDAVQDAESFSQWYQNVQGVNLPFVVELWLEPNGETFVFDSAAFFPLVNMGYALEPGGKGQAEGFHFTTELHTKFRYKGGEEFTFRGDDDVWVFINNQLAIDIGGIHGAQEKTVLLDDFAADHEMTIDEVYPLDLFQAERKTTQSNFRIETALDFTDCGEILKTDLPIK